MILDEFAFVRHDTYHCNFPEFRSLAANTLLVETGFNRPFQRITKCVRERNSWSKFFHWSHVLAKAILVEESAFQKRVLDMFF